MPIESSFDFTKALAKMEGEARAIVNDGAAKAQEVAQREARVDTGAMRRGIEVRITTEGAELVSKEPTSVFIEYGTGVYAVGGGGRKTPWVYRDPSTGNFYTTQGVRPTPFLRPGYQAGKAYIETEGRRRFNG